MLKFFNFKIWNGDLTLMRNVETANFRSKAEEKTYNNSCDRNNDEQKQDTTGNYQRSLRVVTIVSLQSLQSNSRKW